MNRKEMIAFVNECILPDAEIDEADWFYNAKSIMRNIIHAIERWRIGKPINIQMNAKIIDGVLYINNDCVKRVASKIARKYVSDEADYWENRILARAGL